VTVTGAIVDVAPVQLPAPRSFLLLVLCKLRPAAAVVPITSRGVVMDLDERGCDADGGVGGANALFADSTV